MAKFGLNITPFAVGGRFILRMQKDIAAGFMGIAKMAAGVATGIGMARFTAQVTKAVGEVSDMAREFDNIRASSGIIASQVQAMRFSRDQRVGFGTAQDLLGDTGEVWNQYAGAIRDASVRWAAASERAKAAWAAVIGELAPVFSKVLDEFNKADIVGQAKKFGQWLGDGAKVVYQLFSDGDFLKNFGENLKTIIIDYAVSGLMAVGKFGTEVLKYVWETSFSQATAGIYSEFTAIADKMGEYMGVVWDSVLNNVEKQWNDILLQINLWANRLGFGDRAKVMQGYSERVQENEAKRKSIDDSVARLGQDMQKNMKGVLEAMKKAAVEISASMGRSPVAINGIVERARKAIGDFNKQTSARSFDIENRTIGQSFASSSLAAIGGGGMVGPTSLQTMAENTRRQVTLLEAANQKLQNLVTILGGTSSNMVPAEAFPVPITNFNRR